MSATAPRSQALWLLVIIHLSGRVDGITRLHKMAFLTAQLAVDSARVGFYTDWIASKYGPFSPSLGSDLQTLIDQGDVRKDIEQISPNAHMEKFSLTPLGEHFALIIERDHPKDTEAIGKMIVAKYAKAPLMSLLHDVYYLFPQYTVQSEIAGDIFDIGKRRG